MTHTPGPEIRLPVISHPAGPPETAPTLVAVTPPNWMKTARTSAIRSPSAWKEVTRGLPWAPPERAPSIATRSREQATELMIARLPQ